MLVEQPPHGLLVRRMKFGYTILYVQDVPRSVAFYEDAFGLHRKFVHEEGLHAEMDTGTTTLAFAAYGLAKSAPSCATKMASQSNSAHLQPSLNDRSFFDRGS